MPIIGVLAAESPDDPSRAFALSDRLRDIGYIERRSIIIEPRLARGRAEAFVDFANELVRRRVDVLVASNNSAILAAQQATKTIPIVMVYPTDPVELRFVSSLRRPVVDHLAAEFSTLPRLKGKLVTLSQAIQYVDVRLCVEQMRREHPGFDAVAEQIRREFPERPLPELR